MAAPAQIKFTKVPTIGSNDCAVLNITDLNNKAPDPGGYLLDGPLNVTANDNGTVVALTVEEGQIIACAVGVGVAPVTVAGVEGGVAVSGTITATVTLTSGQLHTAWTSGSITIF